MQKTELLTDKNSGLTQDEAAVRLEKYGRNELKEEKPKNVLESFLTQLMDPLIYVLMVAALISVCLKEVYDAVIIGIVVFLNAMIGMIQEGKAKRALDTLKKMTSPKAVVIRDGVQCEIPAAELVIGDLVCLEAGCLVPADLQLIEAINLKIEESALTGESIPIEKSIQEQGVLHQPKNAGKEHAGKEAGRFIGDCHDMAFMSTIVNYGRGRGIVTATGMETEIGKIASMITQSKEEMTPLQKRLGELGKVLSILSLVLCGVLFLVAILQKRDVGEMLITSISLAVAAVPEGLPAVVTICLALSVTKLVKVHAIVRRLPSVETLGAVSVVCSDKTGTLTQNKMTVKKCFVNRQMWNAEGLGLHNPETKCEDFFRGLFLCNDATLTETDSGFIGDPTEIALLEYGQKAGMDESVKRAYPRVDELVFDSDRKMMSTLHRTAEGKLMMYTKGAADRVLEHCSKITYGEREYELTNGERESIQQILQELSAEGLRVLSIAGKEIDEKEYLAGKGKHSEDVCGAAGRTGDKIFGENHLVFLGLVGMQDPVRPEAIPAIGQFRKAGITTVMITGDHVETALAIGRELGIVEHRKQCITGEELEKLSESEFKYRLSFTKVFARVSPLQKVKIVDGFKAMGQVVAMTGDGVNDAPSLKRADIGIAMGKNGTDVARQAADIVLADDNFATIRNAIEVGRGVYENIRKSILFLLSSNLGEIITMFVAVVAGLVTPLKPSHILWVNLITDSLPALALGVDQNDSEELMNRRPRKENESLFVGGGFLCTGFFGCLIAAVSLTAFLMLPVALLHNRGLNVTISSLTQILKEEWILSKSQTYAFTVLGMSQLWHAVGMRDLNKSVFRMKHMENKMMLLACVIGFLLQFMVTKIPILITAFGTSPLSAREWMRLTILAAMPILAHEIWVLAGKKT